MIALAAFVLFLAASFSSALPDTEAAGSPSVVQLGSGNNASNMYFSGRKLTEDIYMNAYLAIYKDIVSGGGKYTPGELSDVIDYYVSNENLASNLSSRGERSDEAIGDILKKAGADIGWGSCYMARSVDSEVCCVDDTSTPGYCFVDSVCQGGKCVPNSGSGCYMTVSRHGKPCCVDYTVSHGYCYLDSVCLGDLCVDNSTNGTTTTTTPAPTTTLGPNPGCRWMVCGNMYCEAVFPYNPYLDEANPLSPCCCEQDCGFPCSSNTTTTTTSIVTTTTTISSTTTTISGTTTSSSGTTTTLSRGCWPLVCGDWLCEYMVRDPSRDESDPYSRCCCEEDCGIPCSSNATTTTTISSTTTTAVNQSCSMTTSIYGEPCCVDASIWPGYCYLNSVCQDGWCVDKKTTCYMTTSKYGDPCCVDSSVPSGYCYLDSTCRNGICVS